MDLVLWRWNNYSKTSKWCPNLDYSDWKENNAIINRMGFNNPGIENAIDNIIKSSKGYNGIVGVNIERTK